MLVNLNCPNCGAALPARAKSAEIIVCEYCSTSFRVPKSYALPEPDIGDLMLGADFNQGPILGWEIQNEDKVRLIPGPTPELRAKCPPSDNVHYVLRSSGAFDNLDASVTICFLEGKLEWVDAGLFWRYSPDLGGYGVFISEQSTYMLGFYEMTDKGELAWRKILDWAKHTALRPGLGQSNRLRMVTNGKRIRIYLNGMLATSFQDARFEVGQVRLGVEPSKNSTVEVAFSNLQLRGVTEKG